MNLSNHILTAQLQTNISQMKSVNKTGTSDILTSSTLTIWFNSIIYQRYALDYKYNILIIAPFHIWLYTINTVCEMGLVENMKSMFVLQIRTRNMASAHWFW